MSRRRRIILGMLVVDLVVVAAFAVWWYGFRQPPADVPVAPAPAAAAPTAAPSDAAAATSAAASADAAPAAPADAAKAPPAVAEAVLDAPLPVAPVGRIEVHGTLHGERFWLRLQPPVAGSDRRRAELVYTPPRPAEISASVLNDSPNLILDPALHLVRWDNRDGATGISTTSEPAGYRVVREVHDADDKVSFKARNLVCQPAWDLRLAPILLALCWRPDADVAVRLRDFWGPRAAEGLALRVKGAEVVIAGTAYTATPAGDGTLATLAAADGTVVLRVQGRSAE